mmetsp:Transcript_9961/g.21930  ORF Transcript_9961/g.21930 Transcript_9961/m.21930 type:complete len:162 (-) Transcript_9961:151-636(-)|eukprot:CAMPEP_0204270270 /NCGR_PEP_ID=MMETSP0468-20130131/18638_1 /ASSEMBLY_ACC=CAM_ASM_000383 /TAXON_ID=2969 /ORGANISM="Oxyrrhis marina" /LENGTH=161 /DNA_ID=CAMNT_0051245781 /DNA_START=43 /DNA_END=528 /DNA_ORIENTATION=+
MGRIHDAVRQGKTGDVNKILDEDENFDLNEPDEEGRSALHHAALANEAACGGYIIELGADVNKLDREGNSALHLAATKNAKLAASMLLWGGAERNEKNCSGETPLHLCAAHNAAHVAWLIIENGGEEGKEIPDAKGRTPIEIARQTGSTKVLAVLEGGEPE